MIPVDGELVMCSRCPLAMYARLVEHADGSLSVVWWCEDCDRPADQKPS